MQCVTCSMRMAAKPYKILLVDDEEAIRNTLVLNLDLEGYEVVSCEDGQQAWERFSSSHFDLIILDIMMPGINGLELCKKIRRENRPVMILFLSARNLGSERVEGLRAGADDYLAKPFVLDELLIRVENLLKRARDLNPSEKHSEEIRFSSFTYLPQRMSVLNGAGETIELTKKENALLALLIRRKNEVVSRTEILDEVWPDDTFPSLRTIDNFIVSFRKFSSDDSRNPRYFKSVRGVGYMFVDER